MKIVNQTTIKPFLSFTKLILPFLLSILFINTIWSQNYYVDKNHPQASDENSGTESSPFKTVQKGINATSAGSSVFIKSGTYEMSGYSKDLNYQISIIGEDKNTTVLNNIGTIRIVGTSNSNGFTMKNLKFTNYGDNVISFKIESNKILDGVLIKNIIFDKTDGSSMKRIIKAREDVQGGGILKNVEVSNCDFLGAKGYRVYCVYLYGLKDASSGEFSEIKILNNTFKDIHVVIHPEDKNEVSVVYVGNGVGKQARDVTISGNYFENTIGNPVDQSETHAIIGFGKDFHIFNNTVNKHNYGSDNEPIYAKVKNATIENNVFINSTTHQGAIGVKGKDYSSDILVKNNRIKSNQQGRAIYGVGPVNITVEDNYVKNTANNSTGSVYISKVSTAVPSSYCRIKNNYLQSKLGVRSRVHRFGEITNNTIITYGNTPIDSEYLTISGNITHTSSPNNSPTAVVSSNITQGIGPLSVNFTGNNSTDNGALSYQWNFHDGTTSTSSNPSHTFTDIRTYMVTLIVTDSDGFKDMAYIKIRVDEIADGTLATDRFVDTIDITIFPNPTENEINIQFLETINIEMVSIYDIFGKEVFTKKIQSPDGKLILNPNLSTGLYIIKLNTSEKGSISKKIIIE